MSDAKTGSQTTKRERVAAKDHRDLSKDECIFRIGRAIGMFAHKRSQLGKRDLNSLCWYLTGEMCAPMIDFGTERSPTFGELRGAVAEAVGIPYTRVVIDTVLDHQRRTHVPCGGEERTYEEEKHGDVVEVGVGGESARPFRLRELQAIVYTLRQSDDKRQSPHK